MSTKQKKLSKGSGGKGTRTASSEHASEQAAVERHPLHEGEVCPPALAPEQTKTLAIIERSSRRTLRQRLGLRRLARLRQKGIRWGMLFLRRSNELVDAQQEQGTALAYRPDDRRRVRLPYWAPWAWTPVAVVMLWRIEQPFVNWLPGLITMSGTVALFLAVAVEADAWWVGRSLASREQSHHVIELRGTERIALVWGVPAMLVIQGALLALRLLRTGQVTSSIALTVAVIVIAAVSAFVHDTSTWAGEAAVRRVTRRVSALRRQIGRSVSEYHESKTQHGRVHGRDVVQPAQEKVAKALGHMAAVDALLRDKGVVPGPWPVSPQLGARASEARGELPEALEFPALPAPGSQSLPLEIGLALVPGDEGAA